MEFTSTYDTLRGSFYSSCSYHLLVKYHIVRYEDEFKLNENEFSSTIAVRRPFTIENNMKESFLLNSSAQKERKTLNKGR